MSQKLDFQLLQTLYTDSRFESMVRALDKLHDAASDGTIPDLTALSRQDLIGWLKEISYLAQETAHELESNVGDNMAEGGQLRLEPHLLRRERTTSNVTNVTRTRGSGRGN